MEVEIRTDLPAKIKREKKRAVVSELNEVGLSPDGAAAEPVKTQVLERTSVGESPGAEIEAEVLRIPPNPRLVICRYWAGGEERRCMVRVGRNSNFVPRMKFWLPEPSDPVARVRPWPYVGPLPRRRGRW
jgi:hypothetical protein